jgi:hypothetical protein
MTTPALFRPTPDKAYNRTIKSNVLNLFSGHENPVFKRVVFTVGNFPHVQRVVSRNCCGLVHTNQRHGVCSRSIDERAYRGSSDRNRFPAAAPTTTANAAASSTLDSVADRAIAIDSAIGFGTQAQATDNELTSCFDVSARAWWWFYYTAVEYVTSLSFSRFQEICGVVCVWVGHFETRIVSLTHTLKQTNTRMALLLVFFVLGFLTDKIRLFPFFLGIVVGAVLKSVFENSFSLDGQGLIDCGAFLYDKMYTVYEPVYTQTHDASESVKPP